MQVLVIGSGGREHAMAQHVAASPRCTKVLCAPGNPGTAGIAENVPVRVDNIPGLVQLARERKVDLTLVGPEDPLCAGVVDAFEAAGLCVFGPTAAAARIEGDKAWAKQLMRQAGIPTAEARIFTRHDDAREYIATRDSAQVVKAAGLARGKGVVVCEEPADALRAAERMMVDGQFGDAGRRIVVEERLRGPEVSLHAIVDGYDLAILESAQDHKALADGGHGPNTGGMGALSPTPHLTTAVLQRVVEHVFIPAVDVLRRERAPFRGVLYAGLMLTHAGPKVLEFNCRFGDPEAQVLLPRLRTNLLDLAWAACHGELGQLTLNWDPRPAVNVVLASRGYPGRCDDGHVIHGLEAAAARPDTHVYLAGTAQRGSTVVTAGGRVLSVTGVGPELAAARATTYAAIEDITFDGRTFRTDIGADADLRN